MTVLECSQQVLRLLDEVGSSDYSDRMFRFIDEAQKTMACSLGLIRKRMKVTAGDGEAVPLPADCYAIERVKGDHDFDVEPTEDGGLEMIFAEGAGVYTVIYKAYPDDIGETDGAKEIQLPKEYHAALCYYAAALILQSEEELQLYQIMDNRYNNAVVMLERAKQQNGKAKVVVHGRSV